MVLVYNYCSKKFIAKIYCCALEAITCSIPQQNKTNIKADFQISQIELFLTHQRYRMTIMLPSCVCMFDVN